MQRQWACPDLGLEREAGMNLPVEGTLWEFPECPAASLRTASEVAILSDRLGKPAYAPHLIGEATHPASIVSTAAAEMESGARGVDSLSPRVLSLVHLWRNEHQAARDHESELRKQKRA
jgi:hypothetical protein